MKKLFKAIKSIPVVAVAIYYRKEVKNAQRKLKELEKTIERLNVGRVTTIYKPDGYSYEEEKTKANTAVTQRTSGTVAIFKQTKTPS